MNTNLRYKGLAILAVILACVYLIIGIPKSKDELQANIRNNIKLGLDLKGGSHLVCQIQVQDAFKAEANATIERMKEPMAKAGIVYQSAEINDPPTINDAEKIEITIKGVPIDKTGAFRQIAADQATAWTLSGINSTDYRLNLKATEAISLRRDTVQRAIDTIEKRINGLGLAEASVQQRGRAEADSEVMVQMPGVDDPARVKDLISKAAVLKLAAVVNGPHAGQAAALQANGGFLPLNATMVQSAGRNGESADSWYVVSKTPVVTGRDLRNARPSRDEMGRWETDFTLSQEAARRFGAYTEANIQNRMAIILDDRVRSAPTIQSRIDDSGRITGAGTESEASDLALILKSGSLPAGLKYLQETTVGPSLGADSIRQGFIAGIAGLIAVVAVMLIYYKGAGVNATLALILNAVMLIAAVSYFEAVMTLPGIAGIILTIGMAVDSNVLIFERIREELRTGKSVAAGIEAGFGRAFLTIIDTHVTTVVSCAFLFIFGSGPVKGFAVTLVIGLVANLFTAVFVSRTIFDWGLERNPGAQSLSI